MDASNIVKILNELIETSENGRKGFAEAAEKVSDASLKFELSKCSQQCAVAAEQLAACVRSMGGEPAEGGTVAGAVHRGWVAVKSTVGGDDGDAAVLEEVGRGEDHARGEYQKALTLDLPPNARRLVEEQYDGCLRNHTRVLELRDRYRHAA